MDNLHFHFFEIIVLLSDSEPLYAVTTADTRYVLRSTAEYISL